MLPICKTVILTVLEKIRREVREKYRLRRFRNMSTRGPKAKKVSDPTYLEYQSPHFSRGATLKLHMDFVVPQTTADGKSPASDQDSERLRVSSVPGHVWFLEAYLLASVVLAVSVETPEFDVRHVLHALRYA